MDEDLEVVLGRTAQRAVDADGEPALVVDGLDSAVLGLLATAVLVPGRHRFAAASTAVLVVAVAALSSGSSPLGDGVVASRFASAISLSSAEHDNSLKEREQENAVALRRIGGQPFLGLGWGVPYDPALAGAAKPKLWVHNQYLGLLLKTGPVGLLGWLLCVFAAVRLAIREASRRGAHRWLALGTAASLIALSTSSLVGIYLLDVRGMSVFAALFALALAVGARPDNPRPVS